MRKNRFEYLWKDDVRYKQVTALPASEYIGLLFEATEHVFVKGIFHLVSYPDATCIHFAELFMLQSRAYPALKMHCGDCSVYTLTSITTMSTSSKISVR